MAVTAEPTATESLESANQILSDWKVQLVKIEAEISEFLSASTPTETERQQARVDAIKAGKTPPDVVQQDALRELYQKRRDIHGVIASCERDADSLRLAASAERCDKVRPRVAKLVRRQRDLMLELAAVAEQLRGEYEALDAEGVAFSHLLPNLAAKSVNFSDTGETSNFRRLINEMETAYGL